MKAAGVRLRGVRKAFPGVVALRDVDFEVEPGEVRALVGENGAGKSTLIKIACGALRADAGSVEIGGTKLARGTPAVAERMGLVVIHQERQIAGDVSITENLLMGRLPRTPLGTVDWAAAHERARELLELVGLSRDPRDRADVLSVSEQQEVEIARAVGRDARVVVMDEPTASLAHEDIRRLFGVIRRLERRGTAVVYVTHHLREIFEVAASVSVMRDGALVGTHPTAGLDSEALIRMMFGTALASVPRAPGARRTRREDTLLEARALHAGIALRDVDLDVARGKIVAVAGGVGSGRLELARALCGAVKLDSGSVRATGSGAEIRSPRDAAREGIVFLPQDRKRDGIFADLSVVDNIDVADSVLGRAALIRPRRRRRQASELAARLRVRAASVDVPVGQLSGGNQQKTLLARAVCREARVLVLDEPTAGIDVGSKVEIYELLRELAEGGTAIVVFSSDLIELKALADRLVILRRGRAAAELEGDDISEERLLAVEEGQLAG